MTEKRPGPTPGVRLVELSVKRELTVTPNKDENAFVFRKESPLLTTSLQRLQQAGVVTWGFVSVKTCLLSYDLQDSHRKSLLL